MRLLHLPLVVLKLFSKEIFMSFDVKLQLFIRVPEQVKDFIDDNNMLSRNSYKLYMLPRFVEVDIFHIYGKFLPLHFPCLGR